jgi:EmrB/QacA subfamily drug resistance transporter
MAVTQSPTATRRSWALALIAAAQFMVIMDTSIIGVALPEIQSSLGFSSADLSWVFNAYVIALGGLLLLGGRLSDLFGARRIFTTGWVVLLGGSAVAGAAQTVWVELLGRALQGAGSALIAPAALTLLMMLFGDKPRELTKALAFYGAAAPAGGTAGVFLGGVLTEYLSWPWVFFINIPVAVVALLATPALMPPGGPARTGTVDVAGAVTVTAGLAAAVYAVVRAPEVGWGSASTWLVLAAAVVLLGIFVAIQAGRREPLMRLSIFRAHNLAAANVAQLLLGAAWIPLWFFLNLYLQQVLGYSAFPAGAALLPMTVLIMVLMIGVAPPLQARVGPKPMIIGGLLALAGGLVWLAFAPADGSFVANVLPATLVAALGQALAFIPSLGTAISAARPEEGGLASGIVNTSYQVGSALGLAAMTALAAAYGAEQTGNPVALTSGFSAAFLGAATVATAGALIILAVFRHRTPDHRTPDHSPEPAAPEPVAPGPAPGPNGAQHAPVPAMAGAGWEPLTEDRTAPMARPPAAATTTAGPEAVATETGAAAATAATDASGPQVRGTVQRADGAGVAAAAITLIDPSGHQAGRATSETDGGYRLLIPRPGSYVLIASARGYQPVATTIEAGHDAVEAALTLAGTAELGGLVSSATGSPVRGAAATLTDASGEVVGADVTTPDGRYRLAMLAAGTYTLVVTAAAFQPHASVVAVSESAAQHQDVSLSGNARLAGIVCAADGGWPVPGARVTLVGDRGRVAGTLDTDETGEFAFTGLEIGQYTLTATGFPAVTHPVSITGRGNRIDVDLAHPSTRNGSAPTGRHPSTTSGGTTDA